MSWTGEEQMKQFALVAGVRLGEHVLQVIAQGALCNFQFSRYARCVVACHEQVGDRGLGRREVEQRGQKGEIGSRSYLWIANQNQNLRGAGGNISSVRRQD